VVNALKSSPRATFNAGHDDSIALLVGVYLRFVRPGRVLEGSLMGVALILFVVVAGQWVADSPSGRACSRWGGVPLALALMVYAFAASALPVWLLLAPRDYLSAFIKGGSNLRPSRGNFVCAPARAHASPHPLYRWQRPGLCRKDFPVLLHHHRVRSHQRISLADLLRHHAQNDSARKPRQIYRLWRDATGIIRRSNGHGRGVRYDTGRLFRNQQPTKHRGRDSRRSSRDHQRLGLSSDRADMAGMAHAVGEQNALESRGRRTVSRRRNGADLSNTIGGERLLSIWYHLPSCSRRSLF